MAKNDIEAIRASDLMKLMEVVKHAIGLWNEIERHVPDGPAEELPSNVLDEWKNLGDALRALGLNEVKNGRP